MQAGSIGGAMDLAAETHRLIVVMHHTTKAGKPKLLPHVLIRSPPVRVSRGC